MKLKAIILDDENDAIDNLSFLLGRYCPDIEVVASYTSAKVALSRLPVQDFDILFLDIEMPVLSGFDFLDKLEEKSFQLIFITSYNQYALKAFKYSALDYILKPIDIEDLKLAVGKAVHRCTNHLPISPHLEQLQRMNSGKDVNKIALPVATGYEFIDIQTVVLIEADGRYSRVHLKDGKNVLVSTHLKDFEEMLVPSGFFRIHNAFLINLVHMKSYTRTDGGTVLMTNEIGIPVSRRKKPIFEQILKKQVPGAKK